MVFAAGFPRLTLVTLDATHQAVITRDACRKLDELDTSAGTAAARFIDRRIDAYAGAGVDGAAPVHDVGCTASWFSATWSPRAPYLSPSRPPAR